MEINLSGKTAVVTGGGRGIGASIALGLARAGADVWIEDILPDIAADTSAQQRDATFDSCIWRCISALRADAL